MSISIKKTRNRLTKRDKYALERTGIINELNSLLGIINANDTFNLYDVENNENIKIGLKNLSEKVIKYFKCGGWNYYIMKNYNKEGTDIGLIRAIYRDEGYLLTTKKRTIEKDGVKIMTVIYYIVKE